MKTNNIKGIMCISALMMMTVYAVQAKTLRVNNIDNYIKTTATGTALAFNTIQQAVDAASAGDTIHIEGSKFPYTDPVTVNKKLTMIGPGYFLAETEKSLHNKESARITADITFVAGSNGAILAGIEQHTDAAVFSQSTFSLQVSAYAGNPKIIVQENSITIRNSKLIYVEIDNAANISSLTIQRCMFNPGVIADTGGAGMVTNLQIENCLFRNSHTTENHVIKLTAGRQNSVTVSQCTFYTRFTIQAQRLTLNMNAFYLETANYGVISEMPQTSITNNIARLALRDAAANATINNTGITVQSPATAKNTWFATEGAELYGKYYAPATGSPLYDATSAERGMFGGGNPYSLSGLYSLPAVYDIDTAIEAGEALNDLYIRVIAR